MHIERIKHHHDGSEEYRITLEISGRRWNSSVRFMREELVRMHDVKQELGIRLEYGIKSIMDQISCEAIECMYRIYDQTQSFDTSSTHQREMDIRSATQAMELQQANMLRMEQQRQFQAQREQTMTGGLACGLSGLGSALGQAHHYTDRLFGREVWHGEETEVKEKKAFKLLKEKIGKKRWKQLKSKGYFEETSKHGVYRFYKHDMSGVRFIQEVDAGGKKRPLEWTLCIQSTVSDMPKGDVILARWMEFKADEEKFRKTANWRNVKTDDEAIE